MLKPDKWTRRDFIQMATGAVAAATAAQSAFPATRFSMPGLYPARVVGVAHSGSSVNLQCQTAPIQNMIRSGMMELTGAANYVSAWRTLFQPADIVGIKVNPNGDPLICSSQACLMEIIQSLVLAGINPKNIVVYERYQDLLANVQPWLPSWVRTSWATPTYLDDQTSISGYDPQYYVDLPQFLLPWQDPSNPAHTRSYAALFASQQVTKIISLAVLKDHNAAGVTLSLKNLSNGCVNNVNRAHPDANTNYLETFIPSVVSMPVIRNKTVLTIIDGVHGLYAGGPHGAPSGVWENKTMYFATDLVAADRIGWRVIDAQRILMGLQPEESPTVPPDFAGGWNVRQPQHITNAGHSFGLGEWRDDYIQFNQVTLA
jgi:hypothetical protein